MAWTRKDLLTMRELDAGEILTLVDTAASLPCEPAVRARLETRQTEITPELLRRQYSQQLERNGHVVAIYPDQVSFDDRSLTPGEITGLRHGKTAAGDWIIAWSTEDQVFELDATNVLAGDTAEADYAFALVGGETDDVPKLERALERKLAEALRRPVTPEEFERVRNKAMGDYARAFNAPESIAHMLVSHHLRGTVLADYAEELRDIRREELKSRLEELLRPYARAASVVLPR